MIRSRLCLLVALPILAAAIVAAVLPSEPGQRIVPNAHAQASPQLEVRIAAQRLEGGTTEFALQAFDGATGQAGILRLPRQRFLSATTVPGRWRISTPVVFAGAHVLRISARLLMDGRFELSLQHRLSANEWSDRILPHRRMFLAYPPIRQWLFSSTITIPQATYIPIANAQGRYSYTGRYTSTEYKGVIGSDLRAFGLTGDVHLSLLCQHGFSISLLGLPEFDADPVDVTLTFSNGMRTTSAWRRYDSTILQSPDPWADFNRLREAKSVSVQIPELLSDAQLFDLTDMFTTPIQDNLEHCGHYAPGMIRELAIPFTSYDTGQLTTVNGASSNARWDWHREPGSLSTVILKEEIFRSRKGGIEANDRDSVTMYMSCDRRGPFVQLLGSAVDQALVLASGRDPGARWSLDGDPLYDVAWQGVPGRISPRDARHFFKAVRQGTLLQMNVGPDEEETFTFDLAALFGSPAQSAFDECAEYPVRTEPLPYTRFDQWERSSVPGVSYIIGAGGTRMLDWWTSLVLDEQSAWSGKAHTPQEMRISCGLDGMAVQLKNVGSSQPVFFRGWPAEVEVMWHTEADSDTETWDVWDLEFYKRGFALSPTDDLAFFHRIHGAETLTISVPTEPHPVTLSFALGEIGVWDTPAGVNLVACDHGASEPG